MDSKYGDCFFDGLPDRFQLRPERSPVNPWPLGDGGQPDCGECHPPITDIFKNQPKALV